MLETIESLGRAPLREPLGSYGRRRGGKPPLLRLWRGAKASQLATQNASRPPPPVRPNPPQGLPRESRGLGSGLASCHWEAALTAREASQRKQAGKWQDLTPATSMRLWLKLPVAHRASTCRPTTRPQAGRLLESKSIQASLRFVLQRRPFTGPASCNSRGFEPDRCRVRSGGGGWPSLVMRPQPPRVPPRILLPPRAFMRGGDVSKS